MIFQAHQDSFEISEIHSAQLADGLGKLFQPNLRFFFRCLFVGIIEVAGGNMGCNSIG
jgi:hypothetical protein